MEEQIDAEKVRQRIQEIENERDRFVRQAELQLAAYDGALQALNALLKQGEGGKG